MHAIRQSCPSALRSFDVNGARRAFSISCARQRGSLPQFLPASTKELSALLYSLNSRILLPKHLTPEQQRLVFRKENKARLEAEPIEITLGNVTLPLEHLDKLRDLPPKKPTIQQIVGKSTTPDDYENLVRMLEGLKSAGLLLNQPQKEKMVRVLSAADQQHLVLKAFQRASATDMHLRSPGLVTTAFEGLMQRALRSGLDEAETQKMLGFAEQFVELMDDKEHLGNSHMAQDDLRRSPLVIRYPLALAALRAKHHTGAQDVDGKVSLYAGRLMEALRQTNYLIVRIAYPYDPTASETDYMQNHLPNEVSQKSVPGSWATYFMNFRTLSRLWIALHVSRHVLGSDMPHPQDAEKLESHLWSEWTMARRFMEDKASDQIRELAQQLQNELDDV
jgi:hypothetical protein